ncbi:BTB/POZ domain-containing protein At3g22104 [Hevea brasiliensis]|uniref:BTB/POZ domain-containing protein At3g22104 n=1 Tax=Hevea brasiliensis TaxID=3981 RepID=UPI0025F3958C|nr:BTB/POZ domain-containing protein At3g22104 [Hevea brasiliensis]
MSSKTKVKKIKGKKKEKNLDLRWVFGLFSWVMAVCCDLEVDVNGEETFMVDKKLISSYSRRLSKLFSKSTVSERNFKLIFNDFPGGAESFELMSRFFYNKGKIDITPYNISLLHCASQFMEMNISVSGTQNMLEQIEKSLQEINDWTWSELLITIKQCQGLSPSTNSLAIVEKCVDSIIGRIALSSESSSCLSTSSPDSSSIRFSCDTRSTVSLKSSMSRATWWFEDLSVLSPDLIEMVVKSLVSQKFDHAIIVRFLFYYQKSKFYTTTSDEKQKIVKTVIDMLYILDWNSVLCKRLFGILRVALSLNISKYSRNKLESMIGSQMDQATLDNLLIPSPHGMAYLYDINLVLRLLKSFLCDGNSQVTSLRLKKVAMLMDLYIAEVAPDPYLKPSKFLALVMALPDCARDSYDEIYRATDIYLQVHAGLSEEEKMEIYGVLNCVKLSVEACMHLSQNKKFSSKSAVQALKSQQLKLKSLLQGTNNSKCFGGSPSSLGEMGGKGMTNEASEQIVLCTGKLELSTECEKLRAHLQGMQCRVMELEEICRKMQTQMTKIMKSRVSSHNNARSLPKLCS